MCSLRCIVYVLLLSALRSPHVAAAPRPGTYLNKGAPPSLPVRPFTVKSFQPYYPPGSGLTGLSMLARFGSFWLINDTTSSGCPGQEACGTVLSVDETGRAYLNLGGPGAQQIFLDTSDGHLAYSAANNPKLPAGAIIVNFLHLGQGTTLFTDRGGGFASEGSALFQWIGSTNDYWFACPRPGPGYQLFKQMTTAGPPDLTGCTVLELAAIDYSGPIPST